MTPLSSAHTVRRSTHFDAMIEDLSARARDLISTGERRVLGITGPPGAGKSTVCEALRGSLGDVVAVVGMDGFHLSNEELTRLGRAGRKGAPDTFDVDGYVALLRRLRARDTDVVYVPRFDRDLEESIGSAVPVDRRAPLVITEGNYLLLPDGGWENVRPALDEVWYLDVDPEMRVDRLIERQRRHGKSFGEARAWTDSVDRPNGRTVAEVRDRADVIVSVPDIFSASTATTTKEQL